MSDCISRQAAIDAICNACGKIDCDKMDKCEKLQLPPANCSEFPNNSDAISRQAAIDALENDKAALDKIIKGMSAEDMLLKYYVAQHNQVSYDIDAIVQLPPIQPKPLQPWEVLVAQAVLPQPDIVRCKDCKHHWTHKCMDSMPIERCDLEQTFYDAEHDFCSLAERRTNG